LSLTGTLSIVGLDGNKGMFQSALALALVEIECKSLCDIS